MHRSATVPFLAWACWLLALGACRPGERERAAPTEPVVLRGEQVVVEVEAAKFFEARVLGVDKQQVKVERSTFAGPLQVSLADVYRVPSASPLAHGGQLGICRSGQGWRACRVETLSPPDLVVRFLDGQSERLAPRDTITASASTELNLRRAFLRAREQADFAAEAGQAGEPTAPLGFHAVPGLRVVAKRASGRWHSGSVESVGRDGVRVVFEPGNLKETLDASRLVPDPLAAAGLASGDFVLFRPTSPAEAWPVGRVRGVTDRQVRVGSGDGSERVIGLRDVLRMRRNGPAFAE